LKTRRFCALSGLLGLFLLPFVLSLSALAQEPKDLPKGPPDRMTLCIDHCILLVFEDGYYVGLNKDGEPESKWRVGLWEDGWSFSLNGVSLAKDPDGERQRYEVSGVLPDEASGVFKGQSWISTHGKYTQHDYTLTWKMSDMNGRAALAFSEDQVDIP
jgi:hypothetical protein